MKKLFISYELALLAKEKGFDEPCFGKYIYDEFNFEWYLIQVQQMKPNSIDFLFDKNHPKYNYVSAPTHQQAVDWLRINHNINILHVVCGSSTKVLGYQWFIQVGMENDSFQTKVIKDYYVGMTKTIKEAFELI